MAGGKKITDMEAVAIIAGNGIGGGVMAVPYLASKAGLLPLLLMSVAAFAAALMMHLMVLEASLKTPGRQVLSILDKYLFRGRKWLIYLFYGLIFIGTLSNLAAYVIGGASVSAGWGLPVWAGAAVFYAICAMVVLLGMKSMGLGEKAALLGMAGITVYMAIVSSNGAVQMVTIRGDADAWLALYGMLMFCLGSYLAVPQVVSGLAGDGKRAGRAVFFGLLINLAITAIIAVSVMHVNEQATQVAIVGWSKAVGGVSGFIGSAFIWLAMATSFWSVSYAMKDITKEQLGIRSDIQAWLCSTLPAVVMLLFGSEFIELLKLAGGATGLVLVFTLIPAFRNSRQDRAAGWSMGKLGSVAFSLAVTIAYIVMVIG
ncbi:MAG TPA: aromatic amino acid transport family protein, partial [Bacillota bacterium]|nr:aromatic amino acid transport family protein [Bacillota bacterium]